MAILERGNENWTALAALIERVGTANVLYAVAAINRDTMPEEGAMKMRRMKICTIVENAANCASRAE